MPGKRAPRGSEHGARPSRALPLAWGTAGTLGLAGVLVPKCPLCLAAYLCVFGMSTGTALALTRLQLPLCLALIAASLLAAALFVTRRRRRRGRESQCCLTQPQ